MWSALTIIPALRSAAERGVPVFVVLVLSLVLATPQRADAMCEHPSWVGTESSSVPTRGSLYVYDEIVEYEAHQHEVSWNGTPGVARQTRPPEPPPDRLV